MKIHHLLGVGANRLTRIWSQKAVQCGNGTVGFSFPSGPVALFFVEQLEKERVRDKEKDKRETESNIMKFIKNKWYIHTSLIEF